MCAGDHGPTMIDPRTSTLVALLALVPVGLYTVGVIDDAVAAVASTLCVLVIAGSLLAVFGAETETDGHEPRDGDLT